MDGWQTFHQFLRGTHIVAGALGLIVFWIPVCSRKGGRLHLQAGRLFIWLAYLVAGTAAVSCAWGLAAPISFTGITRQLTEQEVVILSGNVRFLFAILAALMVWLVAIVQLGVYTIRTKGRPSPTRYRVEFFQVAAMVSGILLVAYGVSRLSIGGNRHWVHIVLGCLVVFDMISALRYLRTSSAHPKAWWFKHMECMLGAGIAFYTAFFVFGFSRIVPVQLEGVWALVPWVLPTAMGVPATSIWVGKYKRQFAKEDPTRAEPGLDNSASGAV